ncbi:MAG: GNAT family N-acetyltransferase [Candidatus Obscuribacterales bacterium]
MIVLEQHFEETPPKEEMESFFAILRAYNKSEVGVSSFRKLILLLKDSQGTVLGGLEGHTYFGWLFIENLAVDESVRKSGWGTKLLEAAHDEARRRGCHHAWLDTFSFQALPFYEKLGYTIFGTLDDFPSSHQRYFLQRAL